MRTRPLVVASCLAAALVAEGCGGDEPRAAPPPPAVKLDVAAPGDTATVREDQVEVSGTVEPAGSAVSVLGKDADVSGGGTFTVAVPLQPGANVIDVIATARGRDATMTAVRVTREMPVSVPDLEGLGVEEMQQRLGDAGLAAEVDRGGGFFDDLLPGEPQVCEQDPEPGSEVRRGTTVKVVVAKSC